MSTTLAPLLTETALFGTFSLLIVVAITIFFRSTSRNTPRTLIFLACIVTYIMSAAHLSLKLHFLWSRRGSPLILDNDALICLAGQPDGSTCPFNIYGTTFVMVSAILSDMILVWRATVIWLKNRLMQVVSSGLIMSLIATAAVASTAGSGSRNPGQQSALITGFTLSWLTNIWATGLISYKFWQHRRVVANELTQAGAGLRIEKILMLFMDSGILYCALGTISIAAMLANVLHPSIAAGSDTLMSRFTTAVQQTISASGLIQLTGIYPTSLFVLVSLEQTFSERTIKLENVFLPVVNETCTQA